MARAAHFKNFLPKSIVCFKEGYSLSTLRSDLFAGINVGILAFPLAMAYAIGAGISPERGLFTAIIGGFLIALLGGSRVQIGGPAGSFIIVLYDIMLRHGFESLVVATLMAGVILIIFGLMGLGNYIKYIPYPITTGLTTGIAFGIFTSQIKDFFGFNMGALPSAFTEKWSAYFHYFYTLDYITLGIALGSLVLMIYLKRRYPKIPWAIVTLIIFTFITWLFHLNIETVGSRYGTLPRTLPHLSFPSITFAQVLTLVPDAFTIALLAGIDALLSAVISEGMTGWKHQSNVELVAQGIANISSVLCGGIPAAGAIARTSVNVKSGAKTPVAGMVHAVTIFLIMLLMAPLAGLIPLAALSAILMMVSWGMSEIHHFVHLFSAPKKDIFVLLAVFITTVLINITVALQVGMILAAFLFMKQMSDLSDVVSPTPFFKENGEEVDDPEAIDKQDVPEGVEVFEINGPFFFGVADRLKNLLNQIEKPPKIFILRMRKVPAIDASGMHALEEFHLECKKQNTQLLLSGVKKIPLKNLKKYHFDRVVGHQHIFTHIHSALAFARDYLRSLEKTTPSPQDGQETRTPQALNNRASNTPPAM